MNKFAWKKTDTTNLWRLLTGNRVVENESRETANKHACAQEYGHYLVDDDTSCRDKPIHLLKCKHSQTVLASLAVHTACYLYKYYHCCYYLRTYFFEKPMVVLEMGKCG